MKELKYICFVSIQHMLGGLLKIGLLVPDMYSIC